MNRTPKGLVIIVSVKSLLRENSHILKVTGIFFKISNSGILSRNELLRGFAYLKDKVQKPFEVCVKSSSRT